MTLDDIPGQSEVKTRLVNTILQGKVAHAQLFAGHEGGPNLALALEYTKMLNCENLGPKGACNLCSPCSKSGNLVHPDVHFVLPVCSTREVALKDAKSRAFLVQWREFITENPFGTITEWTEAFGGQDKQAFISVEESREIIRALSLKAFEGRFKIVLIWLPELMRAESANALLKILEEPPGQTVFLLVTNQPDALLPTISSRTQRIHIPGFTDEEIGEYLVANYEVADSRAAQIAHLANGNLKVAMNYVDGVDNDAQVWFGEWMRCCYAQNLTELTTMSEDFHRMNKVGQKSMVGYGISMFREALVAKSGSPVGRVEGEVLKFVRDFGASMELEDISNMYNLLNGMLFLLERNASAKIQFMDLSISISKAFNKSKQVITE